MDLTKEDTTRERKLNMKNVLKDLLKPVKVKGLVINKADESSVRGIVLTVCPIEKTLSGKDFEVFLAGDREGSIRYALVDGRRFFPRRIKARTSKRSSSRH